MALSPEQRSILRQIVAAPSWKRASPKVRKAVIETVLVESNLTSPDQAHSDRDSEGPFQQRPSQGWGPVSETATQDAEQFLRRAIPLRGQYGNAGELAQAVQRSAYPGRYNQRSGDAAAILRGLGGDVNALVSGGGGGATARPSGGGGGGRGFTTRDITVTPAVDNTQARRQALVGFLLNNSAQPASPSLPGLPGLSGLGGSGGSDDLPGLPNLTGGGGGTDILGLALQMRALRDQPAVTGTVQVPTGGGGSAGSGGSARAAGVDAGSAGGGGTGAARALSWVRSKVGAPGSAEQGENHGQLADYLNKRFGFSGAPWCAMFTSAAVTKGGAPLSARTALVAEVRAKALRGEGYHRGLIDGSHARPGDLILFGGSHIGMVESVEGGRITYVGGNQSDTVSRAQTSARGATVVRPKYGARR